MKQVIMTAVLSLVSGALMSQSLLKNPQTGNPIGAGSMDQIELISDGNEVVLIVADETQSNLYAIALTDDKAADGPGNLVDSLPNYMTKLSTALGVGAVNVLNIEVNPISEAVYFLVDDGTRHQIVVATNHGNDLNVLNLDQSSYCEMPYSTSGFSVQDLTWGNQTLYVSSGELFGGLVGEVAAIPTPFEHNKQVTRRATTMYKTNWGGGYHTNAPLEKMDFAQISGQNKLMGVTVCAPGFSFDPTEINGSGLLQVDEQFNVHFNLPSKVVATNQDGTHYLYNLHRDNGAQNQVLMRIGQHWIDGTPETNNKTNNNAVRLRDNTGQPSAGMTDADIMMYTETYRMIAKYDDHNLLVLTTNGTLKMLKVGSRDPQFTLGSLERTQVAENQVRVFPNPTSDYVEVSYTGTEALVELLDMKGHVIDQAETNGQSLRFPMAELPAGQYVVRVSEKGSPVAHQVLVKE